MAEFCNVCSREIFGEAKPDIDVYKIASSLPGGVIKNVLCEGCGMSFVGKDQEENVFLYFDYNSNIENRKYTIDEWESGVVSF
jgi:hypothetical protein